MQAAITERAPFEIGRGFVTTYGNLAWVVEIEPRSGARQALLIGGPSSMAPIRWQVKAVSDSGQIIDYDEHTLARLISKYPNIAPCDDPAAKLAEARVLEAKRREEAREAMARADEARKQSAADLAKYAPAWAKAALVAELHEDDSDSITDYHNHKTKRRVVIGWSRHERDLFPEMRKAAASFPETAHLADAPESAEHREKYSMGAGYYLKNGWRDSSGWCVKKRRVKWLSGDAWEFSDAAKGLAPAPADAPTGGNDNAPAAHDGGALPIERHTHTKKGFDMWICTLADRVDREAFDAMLAEAKALGGWYSRAWGTTPAGFAFKTEEKARAFAKAAPAEGGADQSSAPAQAQASAPAAPMITPKASAPLLAEKLRAMADGLQTLIDDKFRDRRANTPKQARQAAEARQDGAHLERAQKMMRALADRHEAGTVPPALAGLKTKAGILELAKEDIDRRGAGYYDAGLATGKPYPWREAEKQEQAAALWGLLSGEGQAERMAADALARKIEALRFARIPGYFPTPGGLVGQMLDQAELAPGARVLEPSAGSGAIADAARDAGHSVDCIERHASLCEVLDLKGHTVTNGDFLECQPQERAAYDAVIMNPPFENGQDVAHVRHAWGFVRPGGVLVAIMGAGVMFRQDRRYSDFRAWADDLGGEFVEIPAGTFKASGTGVASVMVAIRKGEA